MTIMKHFKDMDSFHLLCVDYDQNETYKIFYLHDGEDKVLFCLPDCSHQGSIKYKDVCLCGCFDCVSDRNFTWGYSDVSCNGSCLNFKISSGTVQGKCGPSILPGDNRSVFPCNGAVDGRELTYEELLAKMINKQTYLQKPLDVRSIQKLVPRKSKKILKKYLGDNHQSNYNLNENDVRNIDQLAILSNNGELPPEISQSENDAYKDWAKQHIINAYEDYSERLFYHSMNPQEQLLDLLEQIKRTGINETNYSQMKSIILQL